MRVLTKLRAHPAATGVEADRSQGKAHAVGQGQSGPAVSTPVARSGGGESNALRVVA